MQTSQTSSIHVASSLATDATGNIIVPATLDASDPTLRHGMLQPEHLLPPGAMQTSHPSISGSVFAAGVSTESCREEHFPEKELFAKTILPGPSFLAELAGGRAACSHKENMI